MNNWSLAITDLNQACRSAFGETVTYIPALSNYPEKEETPITITGIFSSGKQNVQAGGFDIAVSQDKLEIFVSELGFTPITGDSVIVHDHTYRVVDVEPDPFGVLGIAILLLAQEKNLFS